jgi:hypothetical protein
MTRGAGTVGGEDRPHDRHRRQTTDGKLQTVNHGRTAGAKDKQGGPGQASEDDGIQAKLGLLLVASCKVVENAALILS